MEPFREVDSPEDVSEEQAARWATFYEELIEFEKQILDRMVRLAEQLPPDQAAAVEDTNITPLRDLIKDFRVRAAGWRDAANAAAAEQ